MTEISLTASEEEADVDVPQPEMTSGIPIIAAVARASGRDVFFIDFIVCFLFWESIVDAYR
jgi:hypothetical protein